MKTIVCTSFFVFEDLSIVVIAKTLLLKPTFKSCMPLPACQIQPSHVKWCGIYLQPEGMGIYVHQANPNCPCYNYYIHIRCVKSTLYIHSNFWDIVIFERYKFCGLCSDFTAMKVLSLNCALHQYAFHRKDKIILWN